MVITRLGSNDRDVLMTIEGYPLLRSDIPTKNDRLYTDECLKTILDDLQEFINTGTPIVTFNNPDDYCIDPMSMCGAVTKAVINDHVLYVDIDIIDTPNGRTLFNLPAETRLYFAPHGHGDLEYPNCDGTVTYNKVVNYEFNYIEFYPIDPYFTD